MLTKLLWGDVKNDEEFRKVLKMRCFLWGILLAICIVLSAIGWYSAVTDWDAPVAMRLYGSLGLTMGIHSLLHFMGVVHLLRDKELLHKVRLEDADERNQTLKTKANNTTALVMVILMIIATVISPLFSVEVFFTLLSVLFLYAVLYEVIHAIFNHRM